MNSDVFFVDAYGLTKLSSTGRIVHASEAFGQQHSLSRDSVGSLLFLARRNKVGLIIDSQSLSVVARIGAGEVMHPSGTAVVHLADREIHVADLARHGNVWSRRLELTSARKAKTLNLGRSTVALADCSPRLAMADGNFMALLTDEDSATSTFSGVCGGSFPDTKGQPTVLWTLPLRVQPGALLSVSLDEDAPTIIVHEPAKATAHVATVDPNGQIESRKLSSITMPVIGGRAIYYQPDRTKVVRQGLDGTRTKTYSIGRITRRARAHAAAIDLSNEGRGTVVATDQRTIFVPGHGESMLDLEACQEFSRRLPRSGRKTREAWRAIADSLEPLLLDAGIQVELDKNSRRAGVTTLELTLRGGRKALLRKIVESLISQKLVASLKKGSCQVSVDWGLNGTVVRSELIEVMQCCARHKISFSETAPFWVELYSNRLVHADGNETEAEAAPLEKSAERILLQALLAPRARSRSASSSVTSRRNGLSVRATSKQLRQMLSSRGAVAPAVTLAICWVATSLLGSRSAPLWQHLVGELMRNQQLADVENELEQPLRWIARSDEVARRTIVACLESLDRAGCQAPGGKQLTRLLRVLKAR